MGTDHGRERKKQRLQNVLTHGLSQPAQPKQGLPTSCPYRLLVWIWVAALRMRANSRKILTRSHGQIRTRSPPRARVPGRRDSPAGRAPRLEDARASPSASGEQGGEGSRARAAPPSCPGMMGYGGPGQAGAASRTPTIHADSAALPSPVKHCTPYVWLRIVMPFAPSVPTIRNLTSIASSCVSGIFAVQRDVQTFWGFISSFFSYRALRPSVSAVAVALHLRSLMQATEQGV